jgi:23S rRNA pseudouridine2605 synthase
MTDKTDDTMGGAEDAPAKKSRSKAKAPPKVPASAPDNGDTAVAPKAEAPKVKGSKAKASKAKASKAEVAKAEANKAEVAESEVAQAEVVKAKLTKPKVSKAKAVAPEASTGETSGPGASRPEVPDADVAQAQPPAAKATRAKASTPKPPKIASEPKTVESPASEAWAPATDAGVPGNSAEEKPKVRRAEPPRGGDAPLRRKPVAVKVPTPAPISDAAVGDTSAPDGERIAKAIARAGIASRRDVEAMIEQGRVTLNGRILTSPAINVTPKDVITVDGEPLPARERTRLWIYHKPRGLVTTARDPEGRQTVFEALPEDLPRVVAIGRLDINTEGLLLLTNDGGLAKVVAHPDTGWLRRYRVRAHGDTTQAELDKLRRGVTIDGMDYGPVEATLDRSSGDNLWLTLGLREGKNREVKRILEHLGLAVNRLIRLSFGPFQLGDLEAGLAEEIRTKVLKEQLGPALSEQAGVDFESPVREPIAPFGSPKQQAKQPARSATAAQRREPRAFEDEAPRFARGAERGPSRGGDRPSAPAKPVRVPTGGNSAGPRRSVWRAEDEARPEDAPRRVKIPRRGADPKAEREAAASRGRERVGAISTGERRVLVERLKSSPQEPAAEPHRRDSAVRRQDDAGAPRAPRAEAPARTFRQADERPARRDADAGRPARSFGGEGRPPRRDDDRPRGNARQQDGAERRGPPRGSEERPRGPFRTGANPGPAR